MELRHWQSLHEGRACQIDHVLASARLYARLETARFLNAELREHAPVRDGNDAAGEPAPTVDSDHAPLVVQLARADALVVVGTSDAGAGVTAAARGRGVPVFHASLVPDAAVAAALAGTRVLAFAGIGDPEKLFATLTGAGIVIAATRSFPDHHRYAPAEARMLCEQADRDALTLVTTEKDLVRMQGDARVAALAARSRALPVTLTLSDPAAFLRLLRTKLARAR